jgi:adenine-specific DNA-methyltransferase
MPRPVRTSFALGFCRELLREDGADILPEEIAEEFTTVDADERDYAVACACSLLIGDVRRKELSAYFTPPVLTRAVLKAAAPVMRDVAIPCVLDPACGGGSFLTPIAREIVDKQVRNGVSTDAACRAVLEKVCGLEIDAVLAELSQTLLRALLAREYGFKARGRLGVVRCCDSLKEPVRPEFDLVVGNPPYGRIGTEKAGAWLTEAGLANMGGHTNLYTLFLMRGLRWTKPGGMLVYIVPASFVAGPYFAGLRAEIVRRAEVARIDLHEQRENLFLGAVQDICILTLRRRGKDAANDADTRHDYALSIIDAKGDQRDTGIAVAKGGGEPWILPAMMPVKAFVDPRKKPGTAKASSTLGDYGYRVRVGKVVPTRERKRLRDKYQSGDLPLLGASTIRPDGTFDFDASARLGNARWYAPADGANVKYDNARSSRAADQ